jgi:hypothetical protein
VITDELVNRALLELGKGPASVAYFFDRAGREWLQPLRERGLFTKPTPALREGGWIRFPPWPQARYLARIAGEAPVDVQEVMLELPETDNFSIHADLLEAAAQIPPEIVREWSDREAAWLATQPRIFGLVPDLAAGLVDHLAGGGAVQSALSLAKALCSLSGTKVAGDEDNESSPLGVDRRAHARLEDWEYQELVRKLTPGLAVADWEATLVLFGGILAEALAIAYGDADYSYVWRSGIEDHAQNSDHGVEGALITATRDVCVAAVERCSIGEVIEALDEFEQPTFRRIVLHVIRVRAEFGAAEVDEAIGNESYFNDHHLHHEYSLLLRDRFSECSVETQLRVIDWIIAEPDRTYYHDRFMAEEGREPTEEEVARWEVNVWVRRMAPFAESLPTEWRGKFDEWVAEVGEPKYPDLVAYGEIWVGPTSPLSAAQIVEMGPAEIVDFVSTWSPPGEWNSPTHDGLARAVSQAIEDAPELFFEGAIGLSELPSAYHQWVLHGFEQAAKAKLGSHAGEALKLAQVYLENAGTAATEDAIATRLGLVRFAEAMVRPSAELGPEHRDLIWALIDPLTTDRDPDAGSEGRRGASSMDPLTESLNSTRPQALHAAIGYALWNHRATGATLADLPEVRRVLDDRLERDTSLAVAAVFGQAFPWFVLLDRDWATQRAPHIFPEEDERRLASAWGSYLVSQPPYDSVFEVLQSRYRRAVDDLGSEKDSHVDRFGFGESPAERLTEHLLAMYWRGATDLAEDGLIAGFFDTAPEGLRAHAIEFVGRNLRDLPADGLDPPVKSRLVNLLEWRLAAAAEGGEGVRQELRAFGWWTPTQALEDTWTLDHIEEVIRLAGGLDGEYLVAARLALISSSEPRQSIRAMKSLVESLPDPLRIHGFLGDVRTTAQSALASHDPEAQRAATELIHQLGAFGFAELRELLPRR